MPITLGTNIAALRAQRRLSESADSVSTISNRLASGQRITSAADDAAGLAVSTALNVQSRIYTQAVRNVNDAISASSIAESAVGELKNVVARMRELSMQSANGILAPHQRSTLDDEFQSLSKEYNRIIQSTSFNGQRLFARDRGTTQIQVESSALPLLFSAAETVGSGSFTTPQSSSGMLNEQSIASGDFTEDGLVDLVGVGQNSRQVVLHRGNGNGTFTFDPIYTLSGAGSLHSIKASDLDQDGHLDFAFYDLDAGNEGVQLLFGNGDGTFAIGPRFSADATTRADDQILIDDYNNDGVDDILVNRVSSFEVLLYQGNGDRTFRAPKTVATSLRGRLIGADFNSDGNADFVTLDDTSGPFRLMLGRGDGTFSAMASQSLGTSWPFLHATDFDHDGAVDLIGGSEGATPQIQLWKNRGNGVFDMIGTLGSYGTFNRGTQPVTGDFNGDGLVDIAAGSSDLDLLEVFFGNGDGTFTHSISRASGAPTIFELVTGDIDSDGVDDIVMSVFNGIRAYKTETRELSVSLEMRLMGHFDLSPLSIADPSSAKQASTELDYYRDLLQKVGVSIGASQSRLHAAGSVAPVQADTLAQAAARVTDADIAQESAALVSQRIRQQFAASILTQTTLTTKIVGALDVMRDEPAGMRNH